MSEGQAAASLTLGIKTAEAKAALNDLSKALQTFKSELASINNAPVLNPIQNAAAASRSEITALKQTLDTMQRVHETALAEMQKNLETALRKREQAEAQSSQKLIEQRREYQRYMQASHFADERALAKIQMQASLEDSRRTAKAQEQATLMAKTVVASFERISNAAKSSKAEIQQALGALTTLPAQESGLANHYRNLERIDAAVGRIRRAEEAWSAVTSDRVRKAVAGLTQENDALAKMRQHYEKLQASSAFNTFVANNPSGAATKSVVRNAVGALTVMPARDAGLAEYYSAIERAGTAYDRVRAAESAFLNTSSQRRVAAINSLTAENATLSRMAEHYRKLEGAIVPVSNATNRATQETNRFHEAQKALHAGLRGVSGALGYLWLTYSQYIPAMASGFAAVVAAKKVLTDSIEFDYQTRFVAALGDNKEADAFLKVQRDLKAVSKDSIFNLNDMARGLRVLQQTGIDASLGVNLLSTAVAASVLGETDMKTAMEDLVGTLEVFNLHVEDPEQLSHNFKKAGDIMAYVSQETKANFHDVAESLKGVTGVAQQYGVTLEEVSAIVTMLGKQGIVGPRAGTYARSMIESIFVPKSRDAETISKMLGLSVVNEATGKYKEFKTIVVDLVTKLREYDIQSQAKAIDALFPAWGAKAFRSVNNDLERFLELLSEVATKEGLLKEQEKKIAESTQYQLKQLKAEWDNMFTTAIDGQADLVEAIQSVRNTLADPDVKEVLNNFGETIGKLAAISAQAVSGLGGLSQVALLLGKISAFAAKGVGTLANVTAMGVAGVLTEEGRAAIKRELADYERFAAVASQDIAESVSRILNGDPNKKDGGKPPEAKAVGALKKRQEMYIAGVQELIRQGRGDTATLLAYSKGTFPSEYKTAGTKTLDINNVRDHSAQLRERSRAIVEEYRHEVEMAKQFYTTQKQEADAALKGRVITEVEYQSEMSRISAAFDATRIAAATKAEKQIGSVRSEAERQSMRMHLDNERTKIENQERENQQKEQLEIAHQLRMKEIADQSELVKFKRETLPKLAGKLEAERGKSWLTKDVDLLSFEDAAALKARADVQAQYESLTSVQRERIEVVSRELEESRKLDDELRVCSAETERLAAEQQYLQSWLDAASGAMGEQSKAADKAARELSKYQHSFSYGWERGFNEYEKRANDAASNAQEMFQSASKNMEDAIVKFAKTGKFSFKDFANAILEDMLRIQARRIATGLLGGIGNLFSLGGWGSGGIPATPDISPLVWTANGNAFSSSGITAFAKGDAFMTNAILSSPTLFRFARGGSFGLGVAGEAGAEAVMPLKRNAQGVLGVRASVDSPPPVSVNIINQSGTDVTAKSSKQLKWDGEQWVIDVVMSRADTDPRFRAAMGMGR